MSKVQMVADDVMTRAPKFDKEAPRDWAEDFEIYLMTKNRLNLRLQFRPADLANNATAENKKERPNLQKEWDERNDSVYGIILTLAKASSSEVRDAAINHHREIAADPNRTTQIKGRGSCRQVRLCYSEADNFGTASYSGI
jgi:hypothetical protein